jgi:hypothetical protein
MALEALKREGRKKRKKKKKEEKRRKKKKKRHTTLGIRWWSPTQLLIQRFLACLWESRRDPEFSRSCGRMC